MDLMNVTTDEMRAMDQARAKETEIGLRKRLADIRMDIYTPKAQHSSEIRALKRNLARILTVKNQVQAAAKPAKS